MSFRCFSAYYEDKDVCLQAACNTLCKDIKLPSTSIANSLLENEAAMQMTALILEIKYELKQSSERLLYERHLLLSAFCPMRSHVEGCCKASSLVNVPPYGKMDLDCAIQIAHLNYEPNRGVVAIDCIRSWVACCGCLKDAQRIPMLSKIRSLNLTFVSLHLLNWALLIWAFPWKAAITCYHASWETGSGE